MNNKAVFVDTIEQIECLDIGKRNIYIYGTGDVGILTFMILKERNISVSGFILSKVDMPMIKQLSMQVHQYDVDDYKENDIIIIAAKTDKIRNDIYTYVAETYSTLWMISDKFIKNYMSCYEEKVSAVLMEQIFYKVDSEKATCGKYFRNNYDNKLRSLSEGLDEESKWIIVNCIERIKKCNETAEEWLDIYTNDEKRKLYLWSKLSQAIKRNAENEWELTGYGYKLPINDFRGQMFYDQLGIGKFADLEILKVKNIIDVGAYIGDSSLILSQYTNEKVYAFEPVPKQFLYLKETVLLNDANVIPVNAAVAEKSGEMFMSIGESEMISSLKEIGDRCYVEQIKTSVISIDEFVEENNLEVGLIKIHAEGAEQMVLKGAENTIRNQKPMLIVEMNHTESDFFDIKPILEGLNPNYKFSVHNSTNGLICLGLTLMAEHRV